MAEVRKCPECHGTLVKGKSFADEYAGTEFYTTYFRCEDCKQWHEETFTDRFCGPDIVEIKPVSEAEMDQRLAENS